MERFWFWIKSFSAEAVLVQGGWESVGRQSA